MNCQGIKLTPESICHWILLALSIPQREHGGLNGFWLSVWGQGSYPQLNLKCFVGKKIKRWEERNDRMLTCMLSCLSHGEWGSPSLVFWESLKEDKMGSKSNSLRLSWCAWPSSRQEVPFSTVLLAVSPLSHIHQDQDTENVTDTLTDFSNEALTNNCIYLVRAKPH